MSTHAIVAMSPNLDPLPGKDAAPSGFFGKLFGMRPKPAFVGVYCHDGGTFSDMAPALFNVVRARHAGNVGEAARELVLENPAGWSSLFFFADEARARAWDGTTKLSVDANFEYFERDEPAPGPASYQGDPRRDLGFRVPPIGAKTDKMGAYFVYVLSAPELVVFAVKGDGVQVCELVRLPWNVEPDWEAAESAFDQACEALE